MNKILAISLIVLMVLIGGVYFFTQSNNKNFEEQQQNSDLQGQINSDIQRLKIEILQEGEGEPVKVGNRITVDYVGMFEDGAKFDSSIDRGQPFTFNLGENSVIEGWELGVLGMKLGEKRKITIPPELGYGEQGAGEIIPPGAILVFEIDLLEVN